MLKPEVTKLVGGGEPLDVKRTLRSDKHAGDWIRKICAEEPFEGPQQQRKADGERRIEHVNAAALPPHPFFGAQLHVQPRRRH